MKNVLLLASVASMIQQFNMGNIRILEKQGYQVDIACNFLEGNTCSEDKIAELKNELNKRNIIYYQIDFNRNIYNLKSIIKTYYQTKKILTQKKYDYIHCHSPIGGVIGRLAGYVTKTKVIYTAHGFHFYKGAPWVNWLLFYPVERILSRYTNVLITINKEDYIIAKNRMKSKKVYYLPGVGINTSHFNQYEIVKETKRTEFSIPEDSVIVLSVGELNRNKNHEIVLEAIAEVNNSKLQYVIAGQGDLNNYLIDRAKSLNIEKQVHLLGFRSDIIELYKMADIFCLPSYREGLSVALIEAMASGLPCVCSNIRGNVDLIIEGKGGYLVSNDTSKNYTKALQRLLDVDLRIEMSEFNKSRALHFSSENCDNIMENIYRSI